ncbi:MAG: hypothetical protein EAY72_08945 [Bacteroidetes bacterium]|nr:MAG: hypothetical protein EAY72_08945 [Bacteroidota bacterium]TAE62026.1 MAG: hypothetical protein EAY68_09365 [Bacteroidota bacterium]
MRYWLTLFFMSVSLHSFSQAIATAKATYNKVFEVASAHDAGKPIHQFPAKNVLIASREMFLGNIWVAITRMQFNKADGSLSIYATNGRVYTLVAVNGVQRLYFYLGKKHCFIELDDCVFTQPQ